jgi:hypothetical protein
MSDGELRRLFRKNLRLSVETHSTSRGPRELWFATQNGACDGRARTNYKLSEG